jgi:cell division septum initiation protein DivIVA
MDEDVKEQLAKLLVEMQALRLIVNEALSVALSYDSDPHDAVVRARRHVEETIERTEKMATAAGLNVESQKWIGDKVRASVNGQLDAVEKRASQLPRDRATH